MTERAASDEDKAVLAKYVGWGGLAGAFTKKMDWAQESATLDMMVESGVITKAEWDSFAASTLNAHYTAPEIAQAVWTGVEKLGFTGGRVLEPAVGIGHFIGTVPDSIKGNTGFTALDIDPISARIARALYPDADIKVRPFETFNIPDGTFDLVIGNVPFGDFKLHDPKYNKYNLSIHNYFTLRALDAVHPNGICALITSAYTLDGKSTAARKHMAKRGELLGAVRLPQNAFRRMADTTVETDILFFRRYTPEEEAKARTDLSDGQLPLWVTSPKDTLSNYFEANTDAVIGELDYAQTQYGYREVAKLSDMNTLLPHLHDRITALPSGVYQPWQHDEQSMDEKVRHVETVPSLELRKYRPGGFALDERQVPCIIEAVERDEESGEYEVTMVPVDLSDNQAKKLRALIEIRDQALTVLQEQSEHEADTPRYLDARENLNRRYDAFVSQHGSLNATANRRLFSQDPQSGLLLALESQDEESGAFTKARIFSERVLSPVTPPTSADTPRDAMMISMSYYGEISRPVIMRLLDREDTDDHWAEIEDELRQFMFMDPETRRYLPRDMYLSGNVREKLVAAETAAQIEPELYSDNVEALREVQPRDLTPGDITVQMGAPWIPESDIKEFIYEMLLSDTGQARDEIDIQYVPLVNSWKIELGTARFQHSVTNRVEKELGTKDVPAHKLIEQSLMSQVPKVMRTIKDVDGERRVVDKDATLAAMAKQQALEQRFKQWIWESPERADRLLADYNRRFNCFRPMEPDGSHLTFPGMSPLIELRAHQKNAVWRSLIADNTLFAHEVGTGKAQPLDAKILTPTGWTRMGDIKLGDEVITQSGKPTRVTGVYPQGEKDIYKVVFSDGSSTECCDEHLWLTQTYRERCQSINHKRFGKSEWTCAQPKVRTLAEIRETLVSDHLGAKNHSIPMVDAVQFDKRSVPLDPYTLGVLLGDGSMSSNTVTFSSQDPEIADSLVLPANTELRPVKNSKCPTWAFRMVKLKGFGVNKQPNPVVEILNSLGLMGRNSYTKFIPKDYIYNTVENRVALLQGLMDTDGTVDKKGTSTYFHTVSKDLSDGLVELVQSLGGLVRVTQKIPTYTYKGEKRKGGLAYVLCISLPGHIQPFRLERKATKVKPKTRNRPVRYIVDIVPTGKKEAQCISVEDPSHLYVTDDFIVTHNTYTMIASLMEMRRLGRAKRPFMVVKRNTLGQIETAARDLYPGADVLVMDAKSMTAKNRRQFLSRVAASDFDIAIMSYEAFASIPLSPDEERLFLMDQRDELEDALRTMTDRSFSRKQMEKAKKRLDARISSLLDDTKKDDTFYFDDVMPDALCFDESHLLKNLDVNSRFAEFNKQGSKRSMDALSKVRWLTRIHGREMNIIKSSGTPISNSFAESYTLMRYMMNEQMAELMGTGSSVHPDRFFSNFIQRYTTPEIGVDGQYRVRNRYTIVNIPELMGLMNQFMDVRFADDLGIERPDIKRTIVAAKPTEVQDVFKLEIAERAEKIRSGIVDRSDDNFLKLASDGRKAALDMRLLDPELPDFPGTKLNLMVEEVIERYARTHDFKGAQAVFCDQGTPGGSGFNLYDDIRKKLIAGGVAPDDIAYAHDAKTDEQRDALFAKVNSGEIRVIIGSSEKMGTGTNMQERLCALHHLDAPSNMRPSDVEQREGRIERQGNINSEAEILTYSTEDSFDLFVWNLMNFKRKMVRSIMSNDRSVREYKEDEDGASYEAIMAVTTGNTMIKEKIEVDQKVDMLSAQAREHSAVELRNRREIAEYKDAIPKMEAKLSQFKRLLEARTEWQSGHQSSMMTVNPRTASHDKLGNPLPIEETMPLQMSKWTVNGVPVANRDEADMKKHIRSLANASMSRFTAHYIAPMDIRYAGFPIEWEFNRATTGDIHETAKVRVELKGQVEYEAHYLYHAVEFIEDLPVNINSLQNRIERSKAALHELENKANTPFEHEAELVELKTRQQFLSDALAEAAEAFQQELRNSSAVTSIGQWKAVNLGSGGKWEAERAMDEVDSRYDPLAPSATTDMSIAAAR
jgi:N12 class adenine-specific DNA methylase